jgi:FixJ family two-component response regulator
LIDFFLKDTSGKEIFQKLKAKSVQIPVIFISSANLEEIYDELKDLGAIGFISKTQTSLKTLAFYLKRKLSKIRKGPPEHHAE